MGRQIRRVAQGFDWPLNKVWEGFLNPHYQRQRKCPFCDGSGYNEPTKQIADDWYDFEGTGRRWCDSITQDEVDALIERGRLMDFTHRFEPGKGWQKREPEPKVTAEQVNAWSAGRGMGHDAINQMICVETRATREGVYGLCEHCDGDGEVWRTEADRIAAEAWEETEPPSGEGWQVWETVSEGSPASPVFATSADLMGWLVEQGHSHQAAERFIEVAWVPSLVVSGGRVRQGIDVLAADASSAL